MTAPTREELAALAHAADRAALAYEWAGKANTLLRGFEELTPALVAFGTTLQAAEAEAANPAPRGTL